MEQIQLENNLKLAYHNTNMEIVHIAMFVGVGTLHEQPYPNGIAHFIEHMVFKGTARYPFKALSERIDAIGGEVNAYTTKTYTCYTIKTLKRFENEAISILKEMCYHATFDQTELEKERQVILEEIKMIEDDDEEHAFEQLEQQLFAQSKYKHPILGTSNSVRAITQKDLISFYKKYYTPDNMVLSYVGNDVEHVINAFKNIPSGYKQDSDIIFKLNNCNITQRKEGIEQAHVILAHPAVSYKDVKHPVFEIINSLYGGSMTSMLFRKLREEKGLCYNLYSSVDSYEDGGVLYTYFATDAENVETCMSIIKEIHVTLRKGISQQLLDKTKQYLITNLHMNLDYDGHFLEHMGKSILLYGKIVNIDTIEQQINDVTLDDINNCLKIFEQLTATYQLLPQTFAS